MDGGPGEERVRERATWGVWGGKAWEWVLCHGRVGVCCGCRPAHTAVCQAAAAAAAGRESVVEKHWRESQVVGLVIFDPRLWSGGALALFLGLNRLTNRRPSSILTHLLIEACPAFSFSIARCAPRDVGGTMLTAAVVLCLYLYPHALIRVLQKDGAKWGE